uniref:NADH-ubiquinone oxidoreductase chain 6 n=1 Tax=Graptopsaltria nigrofuscata TaxID=93686 RepID=A0A344ALJ9_9HEMI|nr:NADH dehydrogenase subunit 6 [Graptopsaltria nigrofuscata]AWV84469.1 NADH dehydrogenase subunit 6 [Graptopsaltria nigrofuscata]
MKMLMLMLMMLSMNFIFMKHPLSMGFTLLLQTILSSLTCSLNFNSYFMSYVLFLIFIGGMLILFMYMSSIASNEKFFFSMKLMMMNMLTIFLLSFINNDNFDNKDLLSLINLNNENSSFMMYKLYMLPSGNITLLMIIYLLFSLIVVSKIIKTKNVPLRSN